MAAPKARGLGRGLESLFSDTEIISEKVTIEETVDSSEGSSKKEGGILYLDINDIKPNSKQPRKSFNEEKIEELANSIKEHGLIQPIMVREAQIGYELVAGERRWRAARKAGLKKIPAIIRELDEQQNMIIAIIENMQREDLNAMEEAEALSDMMGTFGMTQEEVARSVGKSRSYIANSLRLLKLPESVRQMVREGELSGGHARAFAGMKEEKEQIEAAKKAVELGWSVREAENYTGMKNEKPSARRRKKADVKGSEIVELEIKLKEILGTKVNIEHKDKRGKIEIEYYSEEELERLVELLELL